MNLLRIPSASDELVSVWIKCDDDPTSWGVEGALTDTAVEADEVTTWDPGTWSGRSLSGNRWEALIPISGMTKGTRYNLWTHVVTGSEVPVMHAAVVEAI